MKPRLRQLGVPLEVGLAFAAMHLLFRTFKRYTPLGQAETESGLNFSPGIAMLVVGVVMISLRRQPLSRFGLTARPFASSARGALCCLAVLALCAALGLLAGLPREPVPSSVAAAAGPIALSLAATLLLMCMLYRFSRPIESLPAAIPISVFLVVLLLPTLVAAFNQHDAPRAMLESLWLAVGAGLGEEAFFRGYVQSRLNEAFGRPWRVLGVDFGPGLFAASTLFGAVHVLNGVDYFAGVWHFRWWHGAAAAATLFYGILRERYGSIAAPALVHGAADILVRLPRY